MNKFNIYTLVPALAFLVASCSTPSAMQSTEYDDMYYTSSDKTEYVRPEAIPQANRTVETEKTETYGGVINPEYSETRSLRDNYVEDEYYDGRTYDPRDNWYRPNYSYVDPYWASAYTPRYSSRYYSAVRDPFYDPFYYNDPFFYDSFHNPYQRPFWGNGVSVSIAFNSVWGNPYWVNPYARPYYSNWYPYNSYYHGFNQGYFYGRNQYIYDRPALVQTRQIQYGPRTDRSRMVTGQTRDAGGRPDRGQLSSDNGQQAVMPGTDVNARPRRTRESGVNPGDTNTKEVITTRPDVRTRTRTERVNPQGGEQRQEGVPVENIRRTRTRGEYQPAPGTNQQPVREEARPIERRERTQPVREEARPVERRERTQPVRQIPVRSSEQRSEPVRSSGNSSGSSSSSSSETKSGGRPTRGGN
jgi:hypothetical protein